MRTVKELFNRLQTAKKFQEKYPDFNMNDGKIHVLFLSAYSNESGYYRAILPALELNRTQTHAAIIGQIHKWDFNKQFDDYDTPIDFRLVQWADYVVLPAMFTDVRYIIKSMREINSDIDFVMDLDVNYYELPDYHPDNKLITSELKDTLIHNLANVEILTASNPQILRSYQDFLDKRNEEYLLYFENYKNLLSHFTFEETKEIKYNTGEKIRIGIIVDSSQAEDLKTIEKPIEALLKKHKQAIEIIIFGWSGKIAEQHELFKNLPVTYEKPTCFYNHPEKLNRLAFDIGLLPFINNSYNVTCKSLNRFLDFAAFMIPVVASDMLPFTKIITDGENGLIASSAEDWNSQIEKLITNTELRKGIGNSAFKTAWEKFSYTPGAITRLTNIFI